MWLQGTLRKGRPVFSECPVASGFLIISEYFLDGLKPHRICSRNHRRVPPDTYCLTGNGKGARETPASLTLIIVCYIGKREFAWNYCMHLLYYTIHQGGRTAGCWQSGRLTAGSLADCPTSKVQDWQTAGLADCGTAKVLDCKSTTQPDCQPPRLPGCQADCRAGSVRVGGWQSVGLPHCQSASCQTAGLPGLRARLAGWRLAFWQTARLTKCRTGRLPHWRTAGQADDHRAKV